MNTPASISLLELNEQVKDRIKLAFPTAIWVRAEISELHENYSGHAYLELIEKDEATDRIIAKTKANCWANTFRMLKPYFESSTNEPLKAGLKILVACSVEYHELYGISLNIKDIEPSFTIGELAMKRMEIIRQLQADGVMDMNKELPLTLIPQRIAVISSATAAGYGDFIDQLKNNSQGYVFYPKLFPAAMQGEQTVGSIISALDKIFEHQDLFDAVVIIRGGGATAELSCFDNYDLAFNCTQFPLPIITGIGHQRDESILDLVAHTSCKTPTAVAEFLIGRIEETHDDLLNLQQAILYRTNEILQTENMRIQRAEMQFPRIVNEIVYEQKRRLTRKSEQLKQLAAASSRTGIQHLAQLKQQLQTELRLLLKNKEHHLLITEKEISMSAPETLLKKGYSLTLKNGKIIKNKTQVRAGDMITTRLQDGEVISVVT